MLAVLLLVHHAYLKKKTRILLVAHQLLSDWTGGRQTAPIFLHTYSIYTYARILLKKKKLVEHNSSHPGF